MLQIWSLSELASENKEYKDIIYVTNILMTTYLIIDGIASSVMKRVFHVKGTLTLIQIDIIEDRNNRC
jgi:hypothetical protein